MIPGIVAHLWQSTLFGGAAWLATLALRTNRAQVRYWVWFTASVKFLLPFSLLVGLGSLVPHRAVAPPMRMEWTTALQELSQPLMLPVAARAATKAGAQQSGYLAEAALGLWACGFSAIAIWWLLRWKRVYALRCSARVVSVPTDLPIPVPVMSAPDLIEPGVFGVLRPVLLLPEGIAERLSRAQLDAILRHEMCHVRRRDNLTATIHMAVQAIFWFHPLTWWIGSRLVDERERACDEDVLRLGCRPSDYAESILMICKLYLSTPLTCLSGVTGSDLKKRIEWIMRSRGVAALNLRKKLALGIAGMLALLGPIVIGILHTPAIRAQDVSDWQTKAGGKMAFEVASVKLTTGQAGPPSFPINVGEAYRPTGGFFKADFPLEIYIEFAYKITPVAAVEHEMFARLAKWITTDPYSIQARAAGNPTKDQMRLMVQSLLAERFQLSTHFETRELPVFALTLAKAGKLGPKLISHADGRPCGDFADATATPVPSRVIRGEDESGPENFPPMCDSIALIRKPNGMLLLGYRNATMDMLAGALSGAVGQGQPVIDKTGLSGRFDFTIEWKPASNIPPPSDSPAAPPDAPAPTSLEALRDQLGLKAESAKAPVHILIIDKVERPSEN
jgi:uncharacterized protein (TIGR03435 family)